MSNHPHTHTHTHSDGHSSIVDDDDYLHDEKMNETKNSRFQLQIFHNSTERNIEQLIRKIVHRHYFFFRLLSIYRHW